jgi:predicted RNA-binding Zn ribbon-like protein
MPTRKTNAFSTIGGHPAMDFLNTCPMGPDGPHEELTDLSRMVAWARHCRLIGVHEAATILRTGNEKAVAPARALRESLRAGLRSSKRGPARWRPLLAELNALLARRRLVERIEIAGADAFSLSRGARVHEADDLNRLIASAIAEFLSEGTWRRARACEGTRCVLWFVDNTRNRSRHWCRMETCGARAKAIAYYRRQRARRRT